MKKNLFILILMLSISLSAQAEYGPKEKRLGLGVSLGEPSGLSGKFYLNEKISTAGLVGWSFFDEGLTLAADILFDVVDLAGHQNAFALPFYLGGGAKFVTDNKNASGDATFGVRAPVGIAFQSQRYPLELAFEVTPGLRLSPKSEFEFGGALIFRVYF